MNRKLSGLAQVQSEPQQRQHQEQFTCDVSEWIILATTRLRSPTHSLTLQINNFRFDDIVRVGDLLLVYTILAGQCHDPTLLLAGHHNKLLIVARSAAATVLAARQRWTHSRHSCGSSCEVERRVLNTRHKWKYRGETHYHVVCRLSRLHKSWVWERPCCRGSLSTWLSPLVGRRGHLRRRRNESWPLIKIIRTRTTDYSPRIVTTTGFDFRLSWSGNVMATVRTEPKLVPIHSVGISSVGSVKELG